MYISDRDRTTQTNKLELGKARWHAHQVFDVLWKSHYQRDKAYAWLAREMGLRLRDCHISLMDLEQCHEVIRLVRTLQPTIEDRDPSEKRFERRKREPVG